MDKSIQKVLAIVVKPLDGSQVSGQIHGVIKENVFLASCNTMVAKKSQMGIHLMMELGALKEEEILSALQLIVRRQITIRFISIYILLFSSTL